MMDATRRGGNINARLFALEALARASARRGGNYPEQELVEYLASIEPVEGTPDGAGEKVRAEALEHLKKMGVVRPS